MSDHKKKVLFVTGTRADYGLLKPMIRRAQKSKLISPVLLVTGMHTIKKFGCTLNEIRQSKFNIVAIVKTSQDDDMLESLAKEILGIRKYCKAHHMDMIVLLGDRDEMLAGAIVASHLKIPIAHIHGGDVTGYVVDEPIRHSITKFSHLHFPATEKSKNRILKLGEENWRVVRIGSPGIDGIQKSDIISRAELAKTLELNPNKKWFLVVHHPTPLDSVSPNEQIKPLLEVISEYNAEKIVIYPNSDTGSDEFIKEINSYKNTGGFHIFTNLARRKYLGLLARSNLLAGNSSSGITEAPFFMTPVVNIGNRQRGREKSANVIDCDYDANSIRRAITKAESKKFQEVCRIAKNPYEGPSAAETIVKTIEKHIKNRKLFYKKFTYA